MLLTENISKSGLRFAQTKKDQRNVVLTNYISLVAVVATLLLLIGRVFFANVNASIAFTLLLGSALFMLPIVLNRFGFIQASRLALCWVPTGYQLYAAVQTMSQVAVHESSAYVGLRFFLLAFSCFPFLVFDFKKPGLFFLGLAGPLLLLFLYDPLLNFFNVGYYQVGLYDVSYNFNNVRVFISIMIIGSSLFILKNHVEKNENLNDQLIDELAAKNKLIQKQAENEVYQLNLQLKTNLDQLRQREFILSESQRIAKVGSWEYITESNSIFWSDEVYNIFGLDKNFDLGAHNLTELLWGNQGSVLASAHEKLVMQGDPYDITMRTKTPLGQTKWVRVYAQAKELNGKIIGASGICHDITNFKEAEEIARKNERNYRSLFEQASEGISMTDLKGNFIDINTSFCKMLRYSREELLLMNIADVLDQEQLRISPIRFDRLASGEHITTERQMVRKDGEPVFVEVSVKIFGEGILMGIARDITSRKSVELEKEKARYTLNERVKELTTLYKCSQILQTESKPIFEVLQEIVSILPDGWQYPSISAARILLGGMEFVTPNFTAFKHRQFSEFKTHHELSGTVEVVYLQDCPPEVEGPFLAEERNLLNMIADMIRIYLIRRHESEALKLTEANQSATINNTNLHIWSVNLEYELISFNKPFANFLKDLHGIEIKIGSRVADGADHLKELQDRWNSRYIQALAGETFKVTAEINDRQFEYSLNPIIEEGKIIGVSVFGEDISERLKYESEMRAANKQMGELRLMALRSVMNPHFIFNCLNSIQYYILENDQRNAVVYLSTFSKLIRAILNNSLNSKVRLTEELDVLRHYIQLESIRFENRFEYSIDVDPEFKIDTIEVPSMLIQPYVENAILHGLNNKKEKGVLKISVRSQDEMIIVEIQDNGIGRKAAAKLKNEGVQQHKSMGTALTEERLKLINDANANSIEIIDLEADGKATGTLVRVWIKE